jgi:quinol monooxygenase YgiN
MADSQNGQATELFIFARFRAREGKEEGLEAVFREQLAFVRTERGCVSIDAFRSARDPGLFHYHSRWVDEAAFSVHAELPNTARFLERVQPIIDHPLDVTRARVLA